MALAGRVVVITGANGGLGTNVTESFLAAGATVVGIARKIRRDEFGVGNFTAIEADLTDSAGVSKVAMDIAARFGRIDALIHVMGGFAGGKPVTETDDATWRRMLDLNLNSGFYAARALLPHLRKSAGRLIFVGSKAADAPHAGLAAYVTSKAALVMLARVIAAENADAGVRVNVVMPGTMDTPGNRAAMPNADFRQWVPPNDVAGLIVWLASDGAAQVNGAVIPIAGGEV